jgi:hypothetical protein
MDGTAERSAVYHHEITVAVTAEAVIRTLDARPASWFVSFLRLAAVWAGSGGPATPWFRLGTFETGEGGVATASLDWRPHHDGELFTAFQGAFEVRPGVPHGAVLSLDGDATEGTEECNDRVLRALLESLGSALDAGQDDAG